MIRRIAVLALLLSLYVHADVIGTGMAGSPKELDYDFAGKPAPGKRMIVSYQSETQLMGSADRIKVVNFFSLLGKVKKIDILCTGEDKATVQKRIAEFQSLLANVKSAAKTIKNDETDFIKSRNSCFLYFE